MKAIVRIAALALIVIPPALAADGAWENTVEVESEQVEVPAGKDFRSDSLAFIVGYRTGDNKFDLKLELGKDRDAAAETGGKLEFRFRRYFPKVAGIEPSLRLSLGENIKNGSGSSFGFYTIQPKLAYDIGHGMEPYVSVRHRQRFDGPNWQTTTCYAGIAFALDRGWEIEPSLFHKSGIETTNGLKVEITRKF